MKTDLFEPRLLHSFLLKNTEKFPDKEALTFEEQRLTYSMVEAQSNQLAESLIDLGIQRHDRIIIFLNNSIETVISIWAIIKSGGVFILLSPTMKASNLEYFIKDSGAEIIISHSRSMDTINKAIRTIKNNLKIIYVDSNLNDKDNLMNLDFYTLLNSQNSIPSKKLRERIDQTIDYDLATLVYTSGSTGEPKGVMCPHFNIVSAARSLIEVFENNVNDIILNVLPLSFNYGLYQVLMCAMFGGTLVLEDSFIFPAKILQKIEKENVTGFPIVPTIIALLLKMKTIQNYKLGTLRYISNTGAALPVPHIQKFNKLFPHTKIYSMFGLTECKRITYLPPEEIKIRPDSVGKAMPNCEVFLVDENGDEVKDGEIGELTVRGSNVMRGYWNEPELSVKVFRQSKIQGEKLLHTGDLFYRDAEGYLYFIGRKDDMIKSKGKKVSPKEVENVLCSIKGIAEAAVIGVPDNVLGQAVKAYVVRQNGKPIDINYILQYCSENMELFMVPKYIEFMNELPRNSNGKVDKKMLAGQ